MERSQKLQQQQARLLELEEMTRQYFEARQEIERLLQSERVLMRREELWLKEKQKLLGSYAEREEQLAQLRKNLTQTRLKLRELSMAIKSNLNQA